MSTTRTRPRSRWTVEQWNERYPVGTEVAYRATWGQQEPSLLTHTRSDAWEQPGVGVPVVMIDHSAGCVPLWALTPVYVVKVHR